VNTRFIDQGFSVNPTISLINESDEFYYFWKDDSVGCAWNAWAVLLFGCVGWEVQEEGGVNDEEGWCRIDELLRRGRRKRWRRTEAYGGSQGWREGSCVKEWRGRTMEELKGNAWRDRLRGLIEGKNIRTL
jgi:hypothetical protein